MYDCKPLLTAIERYLQKADDDLEEELKAEGRELARESVEAINGLEEIVASALVLQTEYFVSEIKKRKGIAEALLEFEKIKAGDTCGEAIRAAFSKELNDIIPKLTASYVATVDGKLVVSKLTKRTISWIDTWSGQLGDMMKLHTPVDIERTLTTAMTSGRGIEETALDILNSKTRNERYKARRAALTEVLRAHSVAQHEAFMLNPSVKGKIWRHTGNYRIMPRENHVDMNGQRQPKEHTFELLGADGEIYYPMFPLDPDLPASESVNCHCLCEPDVDEEILGLPLEERQRLVEEARKEMDNSWEAELDAENRARAGIE